MKDNCKHCNAEYENGETRDIKGRFVKAKKYYCSEYCKHQGYLKSSKKNREKIWFNGQRDECLKRDKYSCVICGSTKMLCVHHKDGCGRGEKKPNNNLENLVTVCHICHQKIHCSKHHLWTYETEQKFRKIEHLSNREIARQLNITHPTVAKMRIVFN